MNLPNKLTMMRVVLVPVFMIFAAVSHYGTADFHAAYMLIAGVIFAIASITDFLDGYLARKNHLVTDFGKFMDPLADKCLTTAAFIYMVTDHVCSPIVLAVILFREFAVAGVRMLAAETGTVIAANMWGKVKTVLQMLTIIFYYFVGALAGPTDVGFVSFVTIVLCWLCGAATLLSGGIFELSSMPLLQRAISVILPAKYLVPCLLTLFLVGDVMELLIPNMLVLALMGVVCLAAMLFLSTDKLD